MFAESLLVGRLQLGREGIDGRLMSDAFCNLSGLENVVRSAL